MPYAFGALVVANALLLGYYLFLYEPAPSDSVTEVQAQISNPISFENTSEHLPPIIGTQK